MRSVGTTRQRELCLPDGGVGSRGLTALEPLSCLGPAARFHGQSSHAEPDAIILGRELRGLLQSGLQALVRHAIKLKVCEPLQDRYRLPGIAETRTQKAPGVVETDLDFIDLAQEIAGLSERRSTARQDLHEPALGGVKLTARHVSLGREVGAEGIKRVIVGEPGEGPQGGVRVVT